MNGISFFIIFFAVGLVIIFAVAVLGFLRLRAAGEQARLLVEKQVELSGQLGQMATEAAMRLLSSPIVATHGSDGRKRRRRAHARYGTGDRPPD